MSPTRRSIGNIMIAASAACGMIALAPGVRAQWTMTNLHPAGATNSYGYAVTVEDGGGVVQTGYASFPGSSRASLWRGTAESWVDLRPGNSTFSIAYGARGSQQAGSAFVERNYHAGMWTGSAGSWIDFHPAGATESRCTSAGGGRQGGYVFTGGLFRASLWSGTPGSRVDLHPAGSPESMVGGINETGTEQVGHAFFDGTYRACLWRGTAQSLTNLHPPSAFRSYAIASSHGTQAGHTIPADFNRQAAFWRGSAASYVSLHPAGATSSDARAACGWGAGPGGVQQAGYVTISGLNRAAVWQGTAESWTDLSVVLPQEFSTSEAWGIASDGVRTYVMGRGRNTSTNRNEALLWTRLNLPPCPADANGDGFVDAIDLETFIKAFETGGDLTLADYNGDGFLDFFDYDGFLAAYEAGC